MIKFYLLNICIFLSMAVAAQTSDIHGKVLSAGAPVPFASILIDGTHGTISDSTGRFSFRDFRAGKHDLRVSGVGLETYHQTIQLKPSEPLRLTILMHAADHTLEEIVITGTAGNTYIREYPIAVQKVSEKQLNTTSAENVIDLLVKNVPGLSVVKTGPNISKPFIRGLGYNRVLTLYDGIRQEGQQWGDEHGIEVDPYNLGHVEVVKGPASLMYGSDALAGVVSFFPVIPHHAVGRLHGQLVSEYQTNNNLIGSGLRLQYSKNKFLFAARGAYRMAKNYRNPVDGRVYLTNFNEKHFSALLGFKSDRGFTHFQFTLFENRQGIPDGSRDSLTRKFTRQVYEAEEDILSERPLVTHAALNSYQISALSQHIQHYRLYANGSYRVGGGDLVFSVAGQQNHRREYNHPQAVDLAGMNVRLNTLNYTLRYNLPKFWNVETSVGFNGMAQENKSLQATDFPIPDYNLLDNGAFIYGKWKKNRWNVIGGIRYDVRHQAWDDFYVDEDPETGFDHKVTGVHNPELLQFAAFDKHFTGLSASLGFTFKVSPQLLLKGNIGRAYRAPNITELASNGLDPGAHIIYLGDRNFDPEFSFQQDIGLSVRTPDFSSDISLFNNNLENYIYLSMKADEHGRPVIDAQGNRTYQYLQSAAHLYGGELWLSWHPQQLAGFKISSSLAAVYGTNKNPDFRNKGIEGEYLPLIPPVKWVSSISQAIRLGAGFLSQITPNIEIEYDAPQHRYLGLNNTESFTNGYTLFNVGATFNMKLSPNKDFNLVLDLNNAFDKAYQSHLNRLQYFEHYEASPHGRMGIYNMGRNLAIKLVIPF